MGTNECSRLQACQLKEQRGFRGGGEAGLYAAMDNRRDSDIPAGKKKLPLPRSPHLRYPASRSIHRAPARHARNRRRQDFAPFHAFRRGSGIQVVNGCNSRGERACRRLIAEMICPAAHCCRPLADQKIIPSVTSISDSGRPRRLESFLLLSQHRRQSRLS